MLPGLSRSQLADVPAHTRLDVKVLHKLPDRERRPSGGHDSIDSVFNVRNAHLAPSSLWRRVAGLDSRPKTSGQNMIWINAAKPQIE